MLRAVYTDDQPVPASTATGEPRGLASGVVRLGGSYAPASMLDPSGRSPQLPNTLNLDVFGEDYILKRVAEVVALFDDPLYSFVSGVAAQTRTQMRTTESSGLNAVMELFQAPGTGHNHHYHRMPWNTRDRDRDRAIKDTGSAHIEQDDVLLAVGASAGRRVDPTQKLAYPVVGGISAPIEEGEEERLSQRQSIAAPRVVPAITPALRRSLIDAQDARAGPRVSFTPTGGVNSIDPSNVPDGVPIQLTADAASASDSVVHRSLRADGTDTQGRSVVTAVPKNNASSIGVPQPTGGVHYYDGVENGDVVALRMMLASGTVTEAQYKLWLETYKGGEGSTRPAPIRTPAAINAVQARQRATITQFAETLGQPDQFLQWRMLPEHLRIVFLTDEARTAIEHATWLAHYQQAWNGLTTPPSYSDRERVPLIDLITHEMTRVPFSTLVSYVILYWRALRTTDRSNRQKDADFYLQGINSVIRDIATMRYSGDFLRIRGHYDVEAKISRQNIARRRGEELRRTGRYHSDLARDVYSHGGVARFGAVSAASSMLVAARDRALERTGDAFAAADDARRTARMANVLLGIK